MPNSQLCGKKEGIDCDCLQRISVSPSDKKAVLCDVSLILKYIPTAISQAGLLLNLQYMLSKQAIFGLVCIKTSLHPPCLNQTGHFSGSDLITSISPPNTPLASSFSCLTASPVLGDQVASCQQSPAAVHLEIHACSELPHQFCPREWWCLLLTGKPRAILISASSKTSEGWRLQCN